MSKRGGVKLKDLKAGKTIWEVDCCRRGVVGLPTEMKVESSVYFVELGGHYSSRYWLSPFVKTKSILDWGTYRTPSSLDDRHVGIPNTQHVYNLHRWFTSRKAAMKYYNRLKADCLTKQEREYFDRQDQSDSYNESVSAQMDNDFFDS